jgi:restriction system protein|nr:winged helix-turn-helix domain-containing protein [Dysgonomonas sp. GY75]
MIPNYQAIMLPLLKTVQDGKEYKLNDVVELLADKFKLTEEEKKNYCLVGKPFYSGTELVGLELI